MERAQLFDRAGKFVATVDVEMTLAGRWPRVVEHAGRTFVLENGRYVAADDNYRERLEQQLLGGPFTL